MTSQVTFRKLKQAVVLDSWELRTENVHKVNPAHVRARTRLTDITCQPVLFSRLDFKGIEQTLSIPFHCAFIFNSYKH